MVTPQRQESDQKVLFKVNYNTPKSRSSTQTSTVQPAQHRHNQQSYREIYSDQNSNVNYNTPRSRSSTQSSTTPPNFVVVKVKDPSSYDNDLNAINKNFVTPSVSHEMSNEKQNTQHRRRYKASHASTTTSSLISNSASPSRKMLPTYDPRQSKKSVNLIKNRYVQYEYNSGHENSGISVSHASSENYQDRPMFMTPLPIQLTPNTSASEQTTISTFIGTIAGPTPPTTAKLRQRTRIIRKLREKRKRILNKHRNMVTISVTRKPPQLNQMFQPSPRTPIKPQENPNRRMIYDMSVHKKPALTFLDDFGGESRTVTERMGAQEIFQKGYSYPVPSNQLTYPTRNHDNPTKTNNPIKFYWK